MTNISDVRPSHDAAIDVLKGLSICGVLVAHSHFDRFSTPTQQMAERLDLAFQWCVPAFFFASGRLARLPTTWDGMPLLLVSRTVRLLLPALVFGGLYHVLLKSIDKRPFFWGGPQLYFLPYLLAITIGTATIALIVKRQRAALVSTIAVGLMYTAVVCPTMKTHGPHWELAGVYSSSFCVGVLFRQAPWQAMISAGYLAAWGAIGLYSGAVGLILAGIVPALYLGLTTLSSKGGHYALSVIGRNAGAIFLVHTPVVMPLASVAAVRVVGRGMIALIATLLVTLIGSLVIAHVARRSRILRPLFL